MNESVGKKRRVIALISPKGGVGRSTAAALLASAYVKRGHRVLLCDLDPCIHTQDLLFGVEDRVLFGLSDLLAGREAQSVLLPLGEEGRLLLCPGGGADGMPSEQTLGRAIEEMTAHGNCDRVILDLPSYALQKGYYRQLADTFLILSTPEPAALLGAQSASMELGEQADAYLLLNRLPLEDLARNGIRPHEMIDLTARPLIGILPESPELAGALAQGRVSELTERVLLPAMNVAARLEGEEILLFEGMKEGKKLRRGL